MRNAAGRAAAALALSLAAGALAACGGATVDNSEPTSVEPLSRARHTPSATSDSPEPNPPSVTASVPSDAPSEPAADGGDVGAREIAGSAPSDGGGLSPQQSGFLDALAAGGIETASARDQLLGTASQVCTMEPAQEVNPFALAAGGQLAEQGHTQLAPEDAGRLIEEAARHEYC